MPDDVGKLNSLGSNEESRWARLRVAARVALATHLLAGLAMATILRHGLETNPVLGDRVRFIADHVVLWRVAWLSWSAAAVSILYFFASFVSAHGTPLADPAGGRGLVLMLAVVAVATDLTAEAIEIGVAPGLARQAIAEMAVTDASHSTVTLFVAFHRTSVMLSGFLANGLYSVIALVLSVVGRREYPKWVSWAGVGVGLSGILLSVACLIDSVRGMVWSNVALIPLLLVWLAGVGLHPSTCEPRT
ncbi:MAG: hypothetical protein IH988_06155 [Planctomycetes bacterium]|nr:hypothetical protein [Planctomycetota bacterium]